MNNLTQIPSKKQYKGSGANAIKGTIETIPNYPKKLVIFKVECSPYYWCRVYVNGRYTVRSLKTESRKEAQKGAIDLFTDVLVNHKLGKTKPLTSRTFANVGNAYIETLSSSGKVRLYQDDKNRFKKELVPHFSEKDVGEISNADIGQLIKKLQERGLSPATTNHYIIVLRKILKYAADNRLINSIPNFPKIHGKNSSQTKRDYFDLKEVGSLTRAVDKLVKDKVKVRGVAITEEIKYLIRFMVNSFLRPTDLRVLKHSHVEVVKIPNATNPDYAHYLILSHPATKTTDQEVVTMPAAYRAYKAVLEFNKARGYGNATDYLFLPEYANRTTMIAVLGRLFRRVVETAKVESEGEKHTLYSLRHSSIMFRLMMGKVNTLQLAKNARTSQAMIEKFYASRLTNLMGVDEIHSFKVKPKSNKKLSDDEIEGAMDIGYLDEVEVKKPDTVKLKAKK